MEFTYAQAIITGFIQGVTELFPVSSLGHAVLMPAWIGGQWSNFTTDANSPYLVATIALHSASAIALFLVFRKRWFALISSGIRSLSGRRDLESAVFWRLVIATIPVAVLGVIFEKNLRELFSKPLASAVFLTINGCVLFMVERITRSTARPEGISEENRNITESISVKSAIAIGFGQSLALFAGISRFGISMSAGLLRGLSHSAASDFAFLLALPVIAGASFYKLPELFQPENAQLLGPILAGSVVSFLCTYASITFLVRWFKTGTLYPFAIYCLVVGVISIIRFAS